MHYQVHGGDGSQDRRVSERHGRGLEKERETIVCLLLGRLGRIVFLGETYCWFIVVAASCIVPPLRCGSFC